LAAAAGLATLDLYKSDGIFEHASSLHGYWQDAMHSLKGKRHIIDIRNMGIVAAIELAPHSGGVGKRGMQLFHKCFDNGLLVRATGDIIALSPPLILQKTHIDEIVGRIGELIETVD
jgi:beta-alanine--pyruvate transaminase